MADAILASQFWAAVRDCLVEFHHMQSDKAAAAVMDSWNRMGSPDLDTAPVAEGENEDGQNENETERARDLANIIYHAQPWAIACNLSGEELSLDECNWLKYEKILSRHQLV